jgi:hypothetical protein
MPHRLKFHVDQSAIDTCHICHMAVRPTPVGPSPGVVGTHPPTHHPPPTRVFLGSSPGVRKFHGCFGKFPGRSGKFRVFLGSSGCLWKVPGVFGKFPRCFGKFRHVFGSSLPSCYRRFQSWSVEFHAQSLLRDWTLGNTKEEVPGCFRKLPSFGTKKTRFAIIQIKSKNS